MPLDVLDVLRVLDVIYGVVQAAVYHLVGAAYGIIGGRSGAKAELVTQPSATPTITTTSSEKVSNAPPNCRYRLSSPSPIMANPVDPALTSSVSASQPPAPEMQSQSVQQPPQGASASKPAKQQQPPKQPAKGKDGAAAASAPSGDGAALTPAELKKKAKADKAARRARERAERDTTGGGPAGGPGGQHAASAKKGTSGPGGAGGKDSAAAAQQKGQKQLPRRGSAQATAQVGAAELKKKQEEKNVSVFGHLYGQQRRTTIAGAGKEVHPAVLALGLQMRDYVVCGSSARCVATLLAFKRVRSILVLSDLCLVLGLGGMFGVCWGLLMICFRSSKLIPPLWVPLSLAT